MKKKFMTTCSGLLKGIVAVALIYLVLFARNNEENLIKEKNYTFSKKIDGYVYDMNITIKSDKSEPEKVFDAKADSLKKLFEKDFKARKLAKN